MTDPIEKSVATNLDELSQGPVDSANVVYLEDLCWEHFLIDPGTGELVTNRTMSDLVTAGSDAIGGISGKTILELGAFEGYYSLSLEHLGVGELVAIEGNPRNFLKCCAVKNHFEMNNTKYLLGDCAEYLNVCDRKFDLVVATGILYHIQDPITALENICRITDTIVIDTTYYTPEPELQGFRFTGNTKDIDIAGLEGHLLYERLNTKLTLGKKHGMQDRIWMFALPTLQRYLEVKGFDYEMLYHEEWPEPLRVRAGLIASRK